MPPETAWPGWLFGMEPNMLTGKIFSSPRMNMKYANMRENIAERLRAEILNLVGDLVPGDQLPTEQQLSSTIGASRSNIREALKLLENEGVVKAIQGKGRFLSAVGGLRVERPVTTYESVTEMLESLGYKVTNLVLDIQETEATETEARALHIEPGAPVIRIIRLRCGNDEPLVFGIDAVPREMLPGPLTYRDWSGSLTSMLEFYGKSVETSLARISAANLPDAYVKRFNLTGLDPWLLVDETCITTDGERVVYSTGYHRGSEIAFNVLRRRGS